MDVTEDEIPVSRDAMDYAVLRQKLLEFANYSTKQLKQHSKEAKETFKLLSWTTKASEQLWLHRIGKLLQNLEAAPSAATEAPSPLSSRPWAPIVATFSDFQREKYNKVMAMFDGAQQAKIENALQVVPQPMKAASPSSADSRFCDHQHESFCGVHVLNNLFGEITASYELMQTIAAEFGRISSLERGLDADEIAKVGGDYIVDVVQHAAALLGMPLQTVTPPFWADVDECMTFFELDSHLRIIDSRTPTDQFLLRPQQLFQLLPIMLSIAVESQDEIERIEAWNSAKVSWKTNLQTAAIHTIFNNIHPRNTKEVDLHFLQPPAVPGLTPDELAESKKRIIALTQQEFPTFDISLMANAQLPSASILRVDDGVSDEVVADIAHVYTSNLDLPEEHWDDYLAGGIVYKESAAWGRFSDATRAAIATRLKLLKTKVKTAVEKLKSSEFHTDDPGSLHTKYLEWLKKELNGPQKSVSEESAAMYAALVQLHHVVLNGALREPPTTSEAFLQANVFAPLVDQCFNCVPPFKGLREYTHHESLITGKTKRPDFQVSLRNDDLEQPLLLLQTEAKKASAPESSVNADKYKLAKMLKLSADHLSKNFAAKARQLFGIQVVGKNLKVFVLDTLASNIYSFSVLSTFEDITSFPTAVECFFTMRALAEMLMPLSLEEQDPRAINFQEAPFAKTPTKPNKRKGGPLESEPSAKRQKSLPSIETAILDTICEGPHNTVLKVVGSPFVFKVTTHYERYARQISAYETLAGSPFVDLPHNRGKYAGYFYILQSYLPELEIGSETELLRFSGQLLQAIDFMHSRGLAHLDLKPNHLRRDVNSGSLRIIDYDISEPISSRFYRGGGTPGFSAPELENGLGTGFAPDMFSVGRILLSWAAKVKFIDHIRKEKFISFAHLLCASDPTQRLPASAALRKLAELL